MGVGLKFGAGPLRVYVPLNKRRRRGPKKKRPPLGPVGVVFVVVFAVSFVVWNHARPHETKPVSRVEQPGNWPLTVDAGTLSCKDGHVLFTAGGVTYEEDPRPSDGYVDIKQITRPESDLFPEQKMDVNVFLSQGTALC